MLPLIAPREGKLFRELTFCMGQRDGGGIEDLSM